jgi:hypothetical protein
VGKIKKIIMGKKIKTKNVGGSKSDKSDSPTLFFMQNNCALKERVNFWQNI